MKFDRFEWFGDEVGASAGGVCEVAAGLFEVAPPGEPERGDEGIADDRHHGAVRDLQQQQYRGGCVPGVV